MATQRYVLIDSNGARANVIEYDPALDGTAAAYVPPAGLTMIAEADYVMPPPSPPGAAELSAYNAAARWRKEIAGVAWGGHVIDTDRESGQSKLLAEFVAITTGMRADPSPWKFLGDDWADLSNADMGAVCMAARDFVAAQFAIERTVKDAIDAGTVTTFAAIDAAFA